MFEVKFINKLLSEVKLSEVIRIFIKLEKRENNFFSLCPFHDEKTASFCVNDKKNIYYCFGCKIYGNSINFLMKYKKFDFKSSVKFLMEISNNVSHKIKISPNNKIIKNYCDILFKISNIYYENLKTDKNIYTFLSKRR